jgi:hypothetical protein
VAALGIVAARRWRASGVSTFKVVLGQIRPFEPMRSGPRTAESCSAAAAVEAVEEAATAAAVASTAAVTAAAAAAKWKRLKRQGLGGKGVEYVRWKRAEAQEMAASREAAIAEAHQMWDRFPVD